MHEQEITQRLGRPELVGPEIRMRSQGWACTVCQVIVTSPEPIQAPAQCSRCGGIAFDPLGSTQ